MERLFEQICNLSISTSWLILAVLAARYLLRKAPKKYICLLWMLVGLRLVVPFSIESSLSLIPEMNVSEIFENDTEATVSEEPKRPVTTGFNPYDYDVDFIYSTAPSWEQETVEEPAKISVTAMLPYVWLIGTTVMVLYFVGSLWTLKFKLSTAVLWEKNIWQSEYVDSPFVFGVVKPCIYIPYYVSKESLDYVLAHEKVHILRKDHWTKAAAFLILCVYWFHPLVWLSYVLLCKDIEIACDEQVVVSLGEEERKSYSMALLACHGKKTWYYACQVGFGEVNVKERIKRVMNYRTPSFQVILTFVVLCIAVGVCFLTSAKKEKQSIGTEDEQEMSAETKLHVLEYGEETLAYTEPEKEDEDYRLYLFDNDVQGESSEMENFHLKDADDVFPDARENNQSIGKFLSIYIAERVSIEGGNYLIVATYEVDGETRYDTRVYRRTENGIEFNRELSERLNQKYANTEEYPVEEVIPMPSDSGEYGYDGSPMMLDVDAHRPKEEIVTLEDEQLMLIAQNKSQWLIEEDIYGSYQWFEGSED